MNPQRKKCLKCGAVKPLSEFTTDLRNKDGRGARCRKCMSVANAKWNRNHREKGREAQRKHYAANVETCTEITRKWNKANPEKRRGYARNRKLRLKAQNYSNLSEMFGPACLDCERKYPMEIYHYHHLDPKTKAREISVIGWAWKSVKAYVENGVVQLCPTCHSMRHFLEREKRRTEKEVLR